MGTRSYSPAFFRFAICRRSSYGGQGTGARTYWPPTRVDHTEVEDPSLYAPVFLHWPGEPSPTEKYCRDGGIAFAL
jgi:hypothetical protein